MRLWLAIQCFWLILFGRKLPQATLPFAPTPALPPPDPSDARLARTGEVKIADIPPGKMKSLDDPSLSSTQPIASHDAMVASGAVQLLGLLQREGRFVDFLREDITSYADAQIGAAVRDIHRGCRKVLDEHLTISPILDDKEEARVRVDAGFDPSRIRLVGAVAGDPPFSGTLKHHGWKTSRTSLPERPRGTDTNIIAPAEVELA